MSNFLPLESKNLLLPDPWMRGWNQGTRNDQLAPFPIAYAQKSGGSCTFQLRACLLMNCGPNGPSDWCSPSRGGAKAQLMGWSESEEQDVASAGGSLAGSCAHSPERESRGSERDPSSSESSDRGRHRICESRLRST